MTDEHITPPASSDLFISYAWTSDGHREWVRLLASALRLLGYSVLIDDRLEYGDSLSGFMREAVHAAHVLMIVDENYVERADNLPDSGVGIENKWIQEARDDRDSGWLSTIFVHNPAFKLPNWLQREQPKGFNFNADVVDGNFPGVAQIDELWRWIEGLPADRSVSIPLAVLKDRSVRLERIARLRDPGSWANPALSGREKFIYGDSPSGTFTIGAGEYRFELYVSSGGPDLVYVMKDPIEAVGLITAPSWTPATIGSFIRPGRVARPVIGQSVVLMNKVGNLCVVTIEEIQEEVNGDPFVAAHIVFKYEVMQGI
ncbi:TIR domain-containing protein [Rathayibacter sp. AY1A3]|uniref:TIR domain-containing protein n=1 Tax=Rathayibacter sp. AY1A3 TaxID=2080521 RepID=UPI000CE74CEA|nr:TIR domain-containing protein [Rathayibacter sp. AY1A3]PPF38751.1 hypothetical protein C5C10_03540 [Rathayibacter sp. AY1A3]